MRTALDSSPLWGAGRVEDPYTLVGHALQVAERVSMAQQNVLRIEQGRHAASFATLEKILAAMGYTLEDILPAEPAALPALEPHPVYFMQMMYLS